MGGLDLDNVVASTFAFHTCVCLLKLLAMGGLTSLYRLSCNVYSNPEDCKTFGRGGDKLKPKLDDQTVERVRRNHLNDIENILPFVLVGALYCLTKPSPTVAVWLFRTFTASRFLHTLSYQMAIPQPSRAAWHFLGLIITMTMAVQVIRATTW